MAFDLDFVRDGSNILRGYLTSRGHVVPGDLSDEDVRRWYCNLQHRLIRPTPRRVHVAPSLVCPPEHEAALRLVIAKIEAGDDVKAHLSKGLLDPRRNDSLFNDWGIAHLHLGTRIESDGFAERTKALLFVHFTRAHAYLIAVQEHGAWANGEFVRTLYRYWPESMESARLRGLRGRRPGMAPLTDAEIEKARKSGVTTFQEIDGSVFAPLGGGYATTGISTRVVEGADFIADQLAGYEANVRAGESIIRAAIAEKYGNAGDPLRLTLERRDDGALFARAEDPPTLVDLNVAWRLGILPDEDAVSAS